MSETTIRQDHETWPAWIVPWNDNTAGVTDMSRLLPKPSGAKGFLRNIDGHFAFEDGTRWRMWALNTCLEVALPPIDKAPMLARRLAKYGVNCLRLHAMDQRFPNGLLMRARKPDKSKRWAGTQDQDTRQLDPEALARLDYFVTCCKAEGIYLDLNLNVARSFTDADGVAEAEKVRWGKGLTYFDEQMIALQKEYAQQVLTHVNPWTGVDYAHEPAIALIEMVNENSLIDNWQLGILHAGSPGGYSSNWRAAPEHYCRELDGLWNTWLCQHYPDREALRLAWENDLLEHELPALGSVRRLRPDEFAAASAPRFADEAQFYLDVEKRYFSEMKAFVRACGAQQLLLGTSDHRHNWSALPFIEANAELDVMDGHFYWQHPRSHTPGKHWSRDDWFIENTPMVDQPDCSVVAACARAKVAGKPFIASEVDEPFPNEHAAEFIPIQAAYALLQDWDGVVFYGFHGMWSPGFWTERLGENLEYINTFGFAQDPVKWCQIAAGALMFLRGDVQAAQKLVARELRHEHVLDSVRDAGDPKHLPFWQGDLPGRLALTHRTAITSFCSAKTKPTAEELKLAQDTIYSDTNELAWVMQGDKGSVLINTPRHQAVIGRAGSYKTPVMQIKIDAPFAAIQLVSLDDQPIAQASSLLLLAGGRVANTGMRWQDAEHTTLGEAWGHAPALFEPVIAQVSLQALVDASNVRVQALDAHGQPLGEPVAAQDDRGRWLITLRDTPASVWYHVIVDHR